MAFFALKSGEWEEYFHTFRNEVKVTEWAFDRIKEAFEKVAKDEARKLSTVQEIMHDMKHRLYCGASSNHQEGKEALRCHICARIVTVSQWKTTFGGSHVEKAHKMVVCDLWRQI